MWAEPVLPSACVPAAFYPEALSIANDVVTLPKSRTDVKL